MGTLKLSILIPAYNVEMLLPRCLDSIVSQLVDGVEVIIVDDGSTDRTLAVAKGYAERFCNLVVYSKDNEGVGAARNMLLDHARGEYIWFVDSDDYIEDGCIKLIQNELDKYLPDMLVFAYNNHRIVAFNGNGEQFINRNLMDGYLWTKVIKRRIIDAFSIRFTPHQYSQEDWLFLMQVYPRLNYIVQKDFCGYYYCHDNENSIMHGIHIENTKRMVIDSRDSICAFKKMIQQNWAEPYCKIYSEWLNYSVAGFLYSLFRIDYSIDEIKRDISILSKSGVYPAGKSNRMKADLFLMVANCEKILIILLKIYRGLKI